MATTPKCNNGWQTCECTVTRCSKYDGDNLPNTGIKTGDTVTVALQRIDNALNPLTITQTILSTLETNLTLQAQFCNIVNNCTPTTTTTTTTLHIYTIGELALGGIVAYILQPGDPGYDADVQHGLIVTVADLTSVAEWGCTGFAISGAGGTAIGTGNQNTIDIVSGCSQLGIAATLCSDLIEGGYSDWYLPSKDELNELYINRVAINGGFTANLYWSSTEQSANLAWSQNLSTGAGANVNKGSEICVRAIRSF